MWTCPKCGEVLEDQFDSCWKCAGKIGEGTSALERNREILRYFFAAFGLLGVSILAVCLLISLDELPSWLRTGPFTVLVLWFAASFVGLLCGVHAVAISDRKTDGFGILVVLLHGVSIFVALGTILVKLNSF